MDKASDSPIPGRNVQRSFVGFLLVVVLPAAVCMGIARSWGERAWDATLRSSHAGVARMTLAASWQELRDGPPPEATPAEEGPAPQSPQVVGRSTSYRTALYRDRERWTGTRPLPGPDPLPPGVAEEVGPGTAVPAGDDPADGVYLARPSDGEGPRLVALAVPRSPAGGLTATPVLLVMGLLLLFGALTAWIQIARRGLHRRRMVLGGVVGPALLPALATLVFLIHVDRAFQDAAHQAAGRDLGRAMAVVAGVQTAGDPGRVRALTGYHATRVRDGRVQATTLPGDPSAVAELPAPPSSFTASGSVTTVEGPSTYVALRLDAGSFLVATALLPEGRVSELRGSLLLLGLLLAGWWMVAAAGAWALSLRGREGAAP